MDTRSFDIYLLLYRLGLSAGCVGFFQTARAVELCRAEPERLLLVTKLVYPEVAKLYKTTWNAVERNIRTVCNIAWLSNRPLLEHLARRPLPRKPHNTQFLTILLYGLSALPGESP